MASASGALLEAHALLTAHGQEGTLGVRVKCERLSAWGADGIGAHVLELGGQYTVVALVSQPARPTLLQLWVPTDQEPSWHDSRFFATVEEATPANWEVRILENGALDIGPREFSAVDYDFWERYWDGDIEARSLFKSVLERMLAVD